MRCLLFVFAAGCVTTLEEHQSQIGHVATECTVPAVGLGAPVSLEYPDASLWIWPNAFARVTSVADACDGPDIVGRPLIALTDDEVAANEARTDGRHFAVVPTGGVVEAGLGYLYYEHVLFGPGFFDVEVLGTGLCVVGDTAPCERITAGGSTLLWTPTQRVLDRGGLVLDGRALIAGCRQVASFDHPCVIAGVEVGALRDPAAYRVFDVFRGWVDDLTDASVLTDAVGQLTLSPFDGAFLATQLDIFANRIDVQWSESALADYGPRIATFDIAPPGDGLFLSGGREHTSLRTRPRSIVVTYHAQGGEAPGLHLVDFHFYGSGELR